MAYVVTNGALPSIERIVPAAVSNWNVEKGACDIETAYLAHAHTSPIKHLDIESALWDKTVMMAFLQSFTVERWAAAGVNRINAADLMGQLNRLGVRNNRTFVGFLSHVMEYCCKHAAHPANPPPPEEGGEAARLQCLTSSAAFVAYFNSEAGRRHRDEGMHYSTTLSKRVCKVCHSNSQRPVFRCVTCVEST